MFGNIRKCLDEFEDWLKHYEGIMRENNGCLYKTDNEVADFFELNLAKALMQDCDAEKVAKIILAAKGLSNEIKVKVE